MTSFVQVDGVDILHDIDPNASPISSLDSDTTLDTEFSKPDALFKQESSKDKRRLAREKLANLTLEEKVLYIPRSTATGTLEGGKERD